MGIFNKANAIELKDEDLQDAKSTAAIFTDEFTKHRAFANVIAARSALKLLFSLNIDATNLYSMYSINKILERLDIADVYVGDIRIDSRLVADSNEIFIPKSHFELGIVPDLYVVFRINKEMSHVEFLGCINPEEMDKSKENKDYYFVDEDILYNLKTFKNIIKNNKTTHSSYASNPEEIERADNLIVPLEDGEIFNADYEFLVKQLVYNVDLRKKTVEFENFEFVSQKVVTEETIYGDSVLGLIGNEKLYNRNEFTSDIDLESLSDETVDSFVDDFDESDYVVPEMDELTGEVSLDDALSQMDDTFNNQEKSEILEETNEEVSSSESELDDFLNNLSDFSSSEDSTNIPVTTKLSSEVSNQNLEDEPLLSFDENADDDEEFVNTVDDDGEEGPLMSFGEDADDDEDIVNTVNDDSSEEPLMSFDEDADDDEDIVNTVDDGAEEGPLMSFDEESDNDDGFINYPDDFKEEDLVTDEEPDNKPLINSSEENETESQILVNEESSNDEDASDSDIISAAESLPEFSEFTTENEATNDLATETEQFAMQSDSDSGDEEDFVFDSDSPINFDNITEEDFSLPDLDGFSIDDITGFADDTEVSETKNTPVKNTQEEQDFSLEAEEDDEDSLPLNNNNSPQQKSAPAHTVVPFDDDADIGDLPMLKIVQEDMDTYKKKIYTTPKIDDIDMTNVNLDDFDDYESEDKEEAAKQSREIDKMMSDLEDILNSENISLDGVNDILTDEELSESLKQLEEEANNRKNKNIAEESVGDEVSDVQYIEENSSDQIRTQQPESEQQSQSEMVSEKQYSEAEQQETASENQDADSEHQKSDEGQQTTDNEQQKSGEEQQTSDNTPSEAESSGMSLDDFLNSSSFNDMSSSDENSDKIESNQGINDIYNEDSILSQQSIAEDNPEMLLTDEATMVDNSSNLYDNSTTDNNKEQKPKSKAPQLAVVLVVLMCACLYVNKDIIMDNLNISLPQKAEEPAPEFDLNSLREPQPAPEPAPAPEDPNANNPADNPIPTIPQPTDMPTPEQPVQTAATNEATPPAPSVAIPQNTSNKISKLSWEVPENLAGNEKIRKYLQIAGRTLKLSLQNDLLIATELPFSNRVMLDLKIVPSGNIISSDFIISSGSKQIDNIVLQSVKDTFKYVRPPLGEIQSPNSNITLIINF